MGWNTWNTFQCNYDEEVLKQMARVLISSGMAKAGYTYLNIDDWYPAMMNNHSSSCLFMHRVSWDTNRLSQLAN